MKFSGNSKNTEAHSGRNAVFSRPADFFQQTHAFLGNPSCDGGALSDIIRLFPYNALGLETLSHSVEPTQRRAGQANGSSPVPGPVTAVLPNPYLKTHDLIIVSPTPILAAVAPREMHPGMP